MQMVRLGEPSGTSIMKKLQADFEAAFSSAEREPWANVINKYRRGERTVFVALDTTGEPCGCAILTFPSTGRCILEYLFIVSGRRSEGLGQAFLLALIEFLREQGTQQLFLEIERPLFFNGVSDASVRRLRFYQKFGITFVAATDSYMVPSFDGSPALSFWLGCIPVQGSCPVTESDKADAVAYVRFTEYGLVE